MAKRVLGMVPSKQVQTPPELISHHYQKEIAFDFGTQRGTPTSPSPALRKLQGKAFISSPLPFPLYLTKLASASLAFPFLVLKSQQISGELFHCQHSDAHSGASRMQSARCSNPLTFGPK